MRLRRRRPTLDTIETNSNLGVRFWTQELMVSRETLLQAVATVGRDVAAVRAHLARTDAAVRPEFGIGHVEFEHSGKIDDAICTVHYVSRPSPTLAATDLEAILSWSRDYNRAHLISGVLLFTGRHFSQILEGPPAAVHGLMDAIRVDPRHREVRVVRDAPISNRTFQDWAMAWVQNFGLRALLEELWWVATVNSTRTAVRAAELVHHLRHAVADGSVTLLRENRMSERGSNESSSPWT